MSDYQGNIIIKNPATPTGPSAYGSAPGMWKLNEVAYWIKQGVWPNPAITPDTYFPYVSLLLSTTSLGNANNNLFVDSSGAFNPVSRNGNTTQGSFTPYSTNWSNYFDGSGDYLTSPDNAAVQFGSGDFTIELWLNFSTTSGIQCPLVSRANTGVFAPYQLYLSGGVLYLYGSTNGSSWNIFNGLTVIPSVSVGTWYHVVLVRSGSNFSTYSNGSRQANATVSGSLLASSAPVTIGADAAGANPYTGYISNLRMVKGSAVYDPASTTITVPTSPLTAISGTSLLTCQSNRFRDASTNNFTITVAGNTSVTDFSPFSPTYPGASYNQSDITNWSGYFDGSGDYLQAPNNSAFAFGTGDFTVEMWAYFSDTGGTNKPMFDTGVTTNTGRLLIRQGDNGGTANVVNVFLSGTTIGSPTFKFNEWTHVAVVRSSGTVKIYINGVGGTGVSATANLTENAGILGKFYDVGIYFSGSMSNVRAVKGTAVYTSNFTPPTSPLTAISGTSLLTLQNAAFTDNSTNNFVLTQYGNPTVTGNSPFNTVGYWSNNFPTTNNGSDNLNFGTNAGLSFTAADDLTVEAWVQLTAHNTYSVICSKGNANTREWSVNINSTTMYFYWSTNGSSSGDSSVTASFSFQIGTLYHIAACKSGSSVRLFVNGTQIGSTGTFTSIYNGSDPFRIATFMDFTGISHCFAGYISNLRVVKGTALYTSNFTVPTAPLTAVSGTSLLTCQNGRFIDNSTNNLTATVSGVPSVQSYNPFYTATIASNGGSMYFDGNGDYLQSNQPNYALGSGDWTVDFWFYAQSNWAATAYDQVVGTLGTDASTGGWRIGSYFGGNGRTLWFTFTNGSYNDIWASANISDGAWHHIAVVRQSGTVRLYRDGVQTASGACTVNFTKTNLLVARSEQSGASGETQCMVSNLRVIKGTCLYPSGTTFTPPTSVQNPTSATVLALNGMNAGIYDATTINDMETVGNAQVSTVQSKFGGSSVYFDGSGDYLAVPPNSQSVLLGTASFTVEFWINPNSSQPSTRTPIVSFGNGFTTNVWAIQLNNTSPSYVNRIQLWAYNLNSGAVVAASTGTISASTWTHVAVVRNGSNFTIYINGVADGTGSSSASMDGGSTTLQFQVGYNSPDYYAGYIDDLRITKGVARYTSNFTPPTQAFPTY